MSRLENLISYLGKALDKPTLTMSKEISQCILIMRLVTEIEREIKHVDKGI